MELAVEDAEFVMMAPGFTTASGFATTQGNGGAENILVRDGRIAAIGLAAAVRAVAGPGAAVARLGGATVVPGLIDATYRRRPGRGPH